MKTLTALMIAGIISVALKGQENPSGIKIEEKFNNPMRNMWAVGLNAGADISSVSGNYFAEANAYFMPRHFSLKGSYAQALNQDNFKDPGKLVELSKPYGSWQLTAVFNLVESNDVEKVSPAELLDRKNNKGQANALDNQTYASGYFVKRRTTRGIGLSVIENSGNLFRKTIKTDSTEKFIELEQNLPLPDQFVIPFSSTVFGVCFQMGSFTAAKARFSYDNLKPVRFSNNSFRIVNFELLYSPYVSKADSIYYFNGEQRQASEIKNITVQDFGFRITFTSNNLILVQRKPGLYFNAETGIRPGLYIRKGSYEDFYELFARVSSQPFYLKVGLGFSF